MLMKERGLDPSNLSQWPYICCLSAYDDANYIENAISAGMHNFMTKPAQSHDLKMLLSALNILN